MVKTPIEYELADVANRISGDQSRTDRRQNDDHVSLSLDVSRWRSFVNGFKIEHGSISYDAPFASFGAWTLRRC